MLLFVALPAEVQDFPPVLLHKAVGPAWYHHTEPLHNKPEHVVHFKPAFSVETVFTLRMNKQEQILQLHSEPEPLM